MCHLFFVDGGSSTTRPHLFPKDSVRDCCFSKHARQFGIASSISVSKETSGCLGCSVNGRVHHSGEEKTDGLFNITEIDAYNRQLLSMRDFQERDADISNPHRFEKLVSHSCNAVAVPSHFKDFCCGCKMLKDTHRRGARKDFI